MRALFAAIVAITSGFAIEAQTPPPDAPDFPALDARLRFRLEPDGQLLIAPDPAARFDEATFAPLVDREFRTFLINGGVLGWLAMFYQGDTDVASMADGAALLARLGRADDASLFQAIAVESGGAPHESLLRLLAIRAAQDRGLKPAIGVLERALAAGIADPHVRRAAVEALAQLRGTPAPAAAGELASLASVLAHAAPETETVLYIDQRRLPAGRPLLRWGRELAAGSMKRELAGARGGISLATWARAVRMALGPAIAPYELARRFGNHRVARIILTGDLAQGAAGSAHLDGVFDLAGLRRGLDDAGIEPDGDADRLEFTPGGQIEVAVTERVVSANHVARDRGMGSEAAASLAAEVASDDAPLVLYLRPGASLPRLPEPLAQFGVPRRVAVWLPRTADGAVVVRVTCDGERMATAIADEAKGLSGTLERALEHAAEPETLEPLVERLAEMTLERDGATVTLQLALDELDVAATVRALIRSGIM